MLCYNADGNTWRGKNKNASEKKGKKRKRKRKKDLTQVDVFGADYELDDTGEKFIQFCVNLS